MARKGTSAKQVGTYECMSCKGIAVMRENTNGNLYGHCPRCGQIRYTYPTGQQFLRSIMTPFGASGPGAKLPEWIREGRNHPRRPQPEPDTSAEETPTQEAEADCKGATEGAQPGDKFETVEVRPGRTPDTAPERKPHREPNPAAEREEDNGPLRFLGL